MTLDTEKYTDIFIEETEEHLESFTDSLLRMEKEEFDEDVINEAYRNIHTLKGSSKALGFDAVGDLAHPLEDLLDRYRERREYPGKTVIDVLLKCSDAFEHMLQELKDTGVISFDTSILVKKIERLLEEDSEKGDTPQEPDTPSVRMDLTPELREAVEGCIGDEESCQVISVKFSRNTRFKEGRVFQMIKELNDFGTIIKSVPHWEGFEDSETELKILFCTQEENDYVEEAVMKVVGVEECTIDPLDITTLDSLDGIESNDDATEEGAGRSGGARFKGDTIRIKGKHLDSLLDLVGEIMINSIREKQIGLELKDKNLNQALKQSDRLMGELQDVVLRMRMVPIDHVFKRFPRMVRDMAEENDKVIDLTIQGNDIEIDRGLLDDIGDCLVHLIRNAIDHGIEVESERVEAGKTAGGSLILSANREQSNVVITIRDDGAGIDPQRIIAKAVEKGIIDVEIAENVSENQAHQILFQAGFSTATQVTEISGRGVGLDVVKNKIESMGGNIRLSSTPGEGTSFTISLPPSMAIIKAMLVSINDEQYAIPLENVLETVKVPVEQIHDIAENSVFRIREEIIPLKNVHVMFGGSFDDDELEVPGIIVEKDDTKLCLLVQQFIGQQDIVVKTIDKGIRDSRMFSGATILGDGKVAMILDVGSFT